MKNKIKGYYFITDSSLSLAGNRKDVKAAVSCGVGTVQYRAKALPSKLMFEEASMLKALCKNALFIINDRIDIALAVAADGVHIGQDDVPLEAARKLLGRGKIIGVTVRGVEEAKAALAGGADYLGVSPIFSTRTKTDAGHPAGVGLIREIKIFAKIPLVAIGGINISNAGAVIDAGADALCAISCVVTKRDVKAEIRKFQALFNDKHRS